MRRAHGAFGWLFVGTLTLGACAGEAAPEAVDSTVTQAQPARAVGPVADGPAAAPPAPIAMPDTAAAGAGGTGPDVAFDPAPAGMNGNVADGGFCDVLSVTNQNCFACHGTRLAGGAPMPLLTHADFVAPAISDPSRKVYEVIGERIHATSRPMPPPPQMMADADKQVLDGWIAAGAPAPAAGSCAGVAAPPPEAPVEEAWPAECEGNTYTLLTYADRGSDEPYVVRGNTETHPQFTFDAPWGDKPVQMVAYRPIIGDGNVAHHWILYGTGGGLAGFGGQFLISWSPGKDEEHGIPDNVGIFLPSGPNSLRLDMHYYNLDRSEDVPDRTGLEICVTENFKEHSATVAAVMASATVPPGGRVDNKSSCTVQTSSPELHLLSVSPHMHGLGVNATLELTRNGMTTVLHDGPFDFEDQTIYTLDNLPLMNGDVLTTTCSFENDTGRTVTFGQSTTDEMCINFLLYYPMGEFACR